MIRFYLNQFLKSIFDSSDRTIFKIIDVLQSRITKLISIKYQAIGKFSVSTESVREIYKDLAYIQGFSKKDSSLILEAYELENTSPDLELVSIMFDAQNPIFLIKDRNSNANFNFSANFIHGNKDVLKLFSIKDTNVILNIISDLIHAKEKEEIRLLKKQIKNNTLHIVSR